MNNATPHMIVFLGTIGLFAWWIYARQQGASTPAIPTSDTPDWWTTPYYLRYNTPMASTTIPIMPSVADDSNPRFSWGASGFYDNYG